MNAKQAFRRAMTLGPTIVAEDHGPKCDGSFTKGEWGSPDYHKAKRFSVDRVLGFKIGGLRVLSQLGEGMTWDEAFAAAEKKLSDEKGKP